MHKVVQLVKNVDKEIKVIVGGAHPTSAPESVLSDNNVDAIIMSEGDNSIHPLIDALIKGYDLNKLDGVGFRIGDNYIINEKKDVIQDLDTIPFPARHLLPMEKYIKAESRHGGRNTGLRATSFITSRGCQYRCNFCTAFKVFTRVPRMRSVDNVVKELQLLVDDFNIEEIYFEDDQIIAKQRHTGLLFDALKDNFNLKWDTPNGVSAWLLNDEILEKMRDSGCYNVNLAIESGNQFVLSNIINKPVKLDQVPGLAKKIRKLGMTVNAFIVVGNIAEDRVETLDQIKDSFKFCRKIRISPHVSYLTAYPGSATLDIAKEKGYLVDGFDWDDLMIDRQQIETPEWSTEELKSLVEWEKIKTRLWFLLTAPILFKLQIIKRTFFRPKQAFGFILFILSSLSHHLYKKLRPIT
jgi:magnesium-protoporphyrin IX monomethyl ester (oxidative) cyclase